MKKLVIVCEEGLRQFGDFLAQLLSLKDDEDGQVVGTRDGAVAAQVWTEKEYVANAVQISSEQYILFIGNSKLFQDKRMHMPIMYSEYGMQYAWLGKQAVLFVDQVVSLDDYDNFFNFAKEHQPQFEKLVEKKSSILGLPESSDEDGQEVKKGTRKLLASVKSLSNSLISASVKGVNLFSKATNNKKIEEQEYSCLVLIFYLNGLSEFLELNEG